VGFGLRWETDPSRVYGLEKDGVTKKPRPIPVGVWYPARPSPAEHMQVADYFDMRSKQVQFDELANRLNKHIRDSLAQSMDDPTAVNRFLAMRTSATFDAPPAKGQFPVVIYGSDTGYEEDFVLFEYLASHGYVVLSTSYHASSPSVLAGDPGVRPRDMLFLHRFAALLGNADASHLAALGYGEGGRAALWWAMEGDTPLDAVAVLGFLAPEAKDYDGIVPRLCFAPDPETDSHRAGQFHVFVPGMPHRDFITNGILREAARPHRNEYDGVCHLTLLFFDAYLKKNPAALAELQQGSKTTPGS
jgi:hypothetical protein